MQKILVTGGCGYKGSILIPKLLSKGFEVVVIDIQWFGNFVKPHPQLLVKKSCILDLTLKDMEDIDVVIHLASVANDPCCELKSELTWEINALATMKLIDIASRSNVKQFIYASSGSVYGIKHEEQVTEELTLEPISAYNKTKMISERILLSYRDRVAMQIVRPATVCGLSPRMRLDVTVNMLTMQALTAGVMTVFGGNQIRPNIHIDDITDLYVYLVDNINIVGIFNAGFENLSIVEIAKKISEYVPSKINFVESNDHRSYRVNSDKLLKHGFKPKKTVNDAIKEIIASFRNGLLKNEKQFYNLKWMKETVI